MTYAYRIADLEKSPKPRAYIDALYTCGEVRGDLLYITDVEKLKTVLHEYYPAKALAEGSCCAKPKQDYPTLPTQAKNAGKALLDTGKALLQGKGIKVDDYQKETRLKICRACSLFDSEKGRCTKCGCYVDLKASLVSQHCPEKKW